MVAAGIGSSNHCMHGKDAVIEEILDWRPYDYVTDRTILATPDGPLRVLHTIELEPTTTGTTIHMRFAAPKAKREMPLMLQIGPAYAHALEAQAPELVARLDAELAAREAGRGPSPSWRIPSPTGAGRAGRPYSRQDRIAISSSTLSPMTRPSDLRTASLIGTR